MGYLPAPFDQHEWPKDLQYATLKYVSTDFASFVIGIGIAKAMSRITRHGRNIALIVPLRGDRRTPAGNGQREPATLPPPFDEENWPEAFRTVNFDEAVKNPYETILELRLLKVIGVITRRDGSGAMIIPLEPGSDGRIIKRGLESGLYPLADDNPPSISLEDLLRELDEEDGLAKQIEGISPLDVELDELLREERGN